MKKSSNESVRKFLQLETLMLPMIVKKDNYDMAVQGDKTIISFFLEKDKYTYDDILVMLEEDAEMQMLASCLSKSAPFINHAVLYSKPENDFLNKIVLSSEDNGYVAVVVATIYINKEDMATELELELEDCESNYDVLRSKNLEQIIKQFS